MPAFSAFCVAAPRSGEGKTTAAMALCRALRERGLAVQAFKCGPDYVDPTFLATASGRRALNLDTWLMGENGVRRIFARAGRQAGVCVVEGVMGLFDGRGPGDLSGSTLDCARVLGLPVILTVNVRGMAASIAPLVAGFLDSARRHGVRIAGVLAQNAGSERHTAMLKAALEEAGLPPLLGSLPRDPAFTLPSRQLGLTPADETAGAERVCAALGKSLAEHADLDTLLALTEMERPQAPVTPVPAEGAGRKRLAVARDSAFCFYYEENLAWLTAHGWDIIPFSPLADRALPPCDAVYLGGGYPEVFAGTLSANKGMRDSVRHAALAGLPVYAECGGFMYLAKDIVTKDGRFPMAGVLDAEAVMGEKLSSLGYREARFLCAPPFGLGDAGLVLRGHEFHWSSMNFHTAYPPLASAAMKDGSLIPSGVCAGPARNVLAGYIHFYWADRPAARTGEKAPGALILLTGPSSAGKTTLAAAIEAEMRKRGRTCFRFSLDAFLAAYLHEGAPFTSVAGAERSGIPAAAMWHAALREAVLRGGVCVADHVLCGSDAWQADFTEALRGLRVLPVRTLCSEDILRKRENGRTDRPSDWEHARAQARAPFTPLPGEITVNTGEGKPEDIAGRVADIFCGRFPADGETDS